ncbi:MAG: nuclear transport factor 2 family protein [Bacteroidales bacterium]|nr:nuclear transport factor 2 family protein [Bacteroidales bacterium]MBN2821438.1 nuclear transport factor 2 family protein [Bacteroidales bacterium]
MKTVKSIVLFIVLITFFSFCEHDEPITSECFGNGEGDINGPNLCKHQNKHGLVDFVAEENAINVILDGIISSFKNQDASTLISMLSDDVIVLGSDPEQVFNKDQIAAGWSYILEQTPLILIPVTERQIVISADGHSATAVEQYNMPEDTFSNVVFRNAYHLVKQKKEWKIICWNGACIMSDDDLLKLNEILGE